MTETAARPRPWSTGDEGSFAQRTLAVRVPQILEDTVAHNAAAFPDDVKEACAELLHELRHGVVRPLVEEAPDQDAWDKAASPHLGKSWLDIPWYFAESFFYRRLLEAVQYFGARSGEDPFLVTKQAEEAHMIPRIQAVRAGLPMKGAHVDERLARLLHAALWGNRADLSYAVGRAFGDEGAREDLLVDDTQAAVAALTSAKRVALLLDNAGTELSFDLLLADELASRGKDVVLYAKSHPFFVSDATPVDVERTRHLLGLELLSVVAHPYMTSSGFFFVDEMPADLVRELHAFDVVIVKGDANYRRLVGDAPWPHSTSLDVASAFCAPFVALRTLKAEVAVGLASDVVAAARARDPSWMTSGRFGVIQKGGPRFTRG
jgi:uncharacterized protein with ATP-grasp and redox domains